MTSRFVCAAAVPVAAVGLMTLFGHAQPPKGGGNPAEEAALLKRAEAFVEAFQKGDAKAVAGFWTPDGDYTDQTGRKLAGREAIEKTFAGLFADNPGLKLRINITGVKFVTPDVAIEDGVTEVIPPDGAPPSRARYTTVHVKKDGQWYLGSVRESAYTPPTNYEHLRGLDWLVGSWAEDGAKGPTARVSFAWAENQNFLVSTFTTSFKNISIGGGTQWIGWDPAAKGVRSWVFESDGGFADGTWTRDAAGKWTVTTRGMLPDGTKVVSKDVITRVDADTLTWQSKERSIDGTAVPDGREVRMKRVK